MTDSATMSDSFVERGKKEKEKLKLSNSNKLREDLHSIFEREEHFDLTFVHKKILWNVHTAILQQRAPVFFNCMKGYGEEVSLTFLEEEDYDSFGNWLRALYTEDNLDKYETSVKEWISKLEKHNEGKQNDINNDNPNSFTENVIQTSADETQYMDTKNVHNELRTDEGSTGQLEESLTGKTIPCASKVGTIFPSVPECCSQLGNDLLSILLNGQGADLELRVVDGVVNVHKFIVSGRTHYFAAMLSGAWSESSKSYIYLQNFSLSGLLSVLYYIYGGVLDIPQTVSICEVLFLADMYNLHGMKDVVMLRLKRENCHFFHKPCADCLTSAPEALALSIQFREENFTKACLRWMTKHFVKVWQSKSFAAMGKQLMEVCYQNALEELKPDSVVTLVTQSDKLLETLPRVKWNESLVELVERLRDAALNYIAENFTVVSSHKNFQPLIQGMGWSCNLLELMFNKVVALLNAKTANSVFLSANYLKKMAETEEISSSVSSVLVEFYFKCYTYMVGNANHQVLNDDWSSLPEELKNKIVQDAVYVDERKKTLVAKPKLSSASRPKTKPPQVEKPASAAATRSMGTSLMGTRPKTRIASAKPTELTPKSSARTKPLDKTSSNVPTSSNRKQPESTKSKEASAKSTRISIKSREASGKSTNASTKPKEPSKKPTDSSVKPKLHSTKATEAGAKSKEPSAKAKEPRSKDPSSRVEKPRRPQSSTKSSSNTQPIQEKKVHTEIKSAVASSVRLRPAPGNSQKPPIDKKTRPVKQVSSKTGATQISSKPSSSASGSTSTRVQKLTKPPHGKPLSSDKRGRLKSKDVTDNKLQTDARRKVSPVKNNLSSKTKVESINRSEDIEKEDSSLKVEKDDACFKSEEAGAIDKSETDEVSKKLNTSQIYTPKSSNITIRVSDNSEENNGDEDDGKEQPHDRADDSIDKIADGFANISISGDGLCTAASEEGGDDTAVGDSLLISSVSSEDRSCSTSQLPSDTAIKCDDIYDEKSNNTEASDIAMDDDDIISASDNGGGLGEDNEAMCSEDIQASDNEGGLGEEEDAMCSEDIQNIKVVEDESKDREPLIDDKFNRNEAVPDIDNPVEAGEEAELSDVACDDVDDNVEDNIHENDLERVDDEDEIHITDTANDECARNVNEINDAFAEDMSGMSKPDDIVEVNNETIALSLRDDRHPERSNEQIEHGIAGDINELAQICQDDYVEDQACSDRELKDEGEINAVIEDTGMDEDNMVPDWKIDDQNGDHEQLNDTDCSIPFEEDIGVEETKSIHYEHQYKDVEETDNPVCTDNGDKRLPEDFPFGANKDEDAESIQYGIQCEERDKNEDCSQFESVAKADNGAYENLMPEDILYHDNDDSEIQYRQAETMSIGSSEITANDCAVTDDNMLSDAIPSGGFKQEANCVDERDSAEESHPEGDEEDEGSNGRLILSKALQFGSTNGATLGPSS